MGSVDASPLRSDRPLNWNAAPDFEHDDYADLAQDNCDTLQGMAQSIKQEVAVFNEETDRLQREALFKFNMEKPNGGAAKAMHAAGRAAKFAAMAKAVAVHDTKAAFSALRAAEKAERHRRYLGRSDEKWDEPLRPTSADRVYNLDADDSSDEDSATAAPAPAAARSKTGGRARGAEWRKERLRQLRKQAEQEASSDEDEPGARGGALQLPQLGRAVARACTCRASRRKGAACTCGGGVQPLSGDELADAALANGTAALSKSKKGKRDTNKQPKGASGEGGAGGGKGGDAGRQLRERRKAGLDSEKKKSTARLPPSRTVTRL
jgi:hypothetical protein